MDHLQGILDELLKRKLREALDGIEQKKLRKKEREADKDDRNRTGDMQDVQAPRPRGRGKPPTT